MPPGTDRRRYLHNQRLGKVVVKDSASLDGRFLHYLLCGADYRNEVLASATGTTVKHTSPGRIGRFTFLLPPLDEQRAIAHALGTLDDRIDLNRRMAETLEAMARALFQSWFVDFDPVRAKAEGRDPGLPNHLADLFPARLVDSELGEIPEGWTTQSVESIADRVAMGPFGSSIRVSTFVEDGVPVISGQHLRGTLLDDSEFNFVASEHAAELSRSNVQRGDVVFTHAGSIGQVAYIPDTSRYERYVISQRQFYVRCDPGKMSPLYVVLYFKTPEGQHRLLANTSSTGVPSISQPVTYLRGLLILVPPRPILDVFDSLARTAYRSVVARTLESSALSALRDTLLPKLISGELRVKDAERVVSGIAR